MIVSLPLFCTNDLMNLQNLTGHHGDKWILWIPIARRCLANQSVQHFDEVGRASHCLSWAKLPGPILSDLCLLIMTTRLTEAISPSNAQILRTCCEFTIVLGAEEGVHDLTHHPQQQIIPPKVSTCKRTGQIVNANSSEIGSVKTEGKSKVYQKSEQPC